MKRCGGRSVGELKRREVCVEGTGELGLDASRDPGSSEGTVPPPGSPPAGPQCASAATPPRATPRASYLPAARAEGRTADPYALVKGTSVVTS